MRSSSGLRIGNSINQRQASIGQAARSISTWRNSIDALSQVSNRMLGTPSAFSLFLLAVVSAILLVNGIPQFSIVKWQRAVPAYSMRWACLR